MGDTRTHESAPLAMAAPKNKSLKPIQKVLCSKVIVIGGKVNYDVTDAQDQTES